MFSALRSAISAGDLNPPSQSGVLATCPYSPCRPDATRPPTHHSPTPAGGTSGLQLTPPPGTGQEVCHGHLRPRPVHDPAVEGLQRKVPLGNPRVDIHHAVELLEGGVVRVEGERATQQVVTKGADRPSDGETLLLHHAVPTLPV